MPDVSAFDWNSHYAQRHTHMQAVLEAAFSPEKRQLLYEAGSVLVEALTHGHKLLSCGNGGSFCDAMHFAEELTGRFRENRPPLAAMALSDPGHLSCVANDYGYDQVFARMVAALGRPGDVLVAISTSGNSPNVLRAAEAAQAANMKVIALTGNTGGQLAALSTVELRVPHSGFADRIQEVHIKYLHLLIERIEAELGYSQPMP